MLIQTAGLNILLDPVWSKRVSPFRFVGPKRVNDPGIAFADLPSIDVVLVSHGHYDQLDLTTLSRLAAIHHPRVVTPLGNDTIMRNHDPTIAAEAYDWEDQVNIGAGVVATLVATRHWSAGFWRTFAGRRRKFKALTCPNLRNASRSRPGGAKPSPPR